MTSMNVEQYLDSLDEKTAADSHALVALMQRISGQTPQLWNEHTLGFGTYHYKYDSGREGNGLIIGFYPRKGKISIYVMDGTARYAELLAQLGKHTTTGYCVYIKQLSDIELPVLERLLQASYDNIKAKAENGPITEILWKMA